MCSIKLVAIDFDGTCSNYIPRPHIDIAVHEQLAKFQEMGVKWAINSDRSFVDLLSVIEKMPRRAYPQAVLSRQREIYLIDEEFNYCPHKTWNCRQWEKHSTLWDTIQEYFGEWSRKIHERYDVQLSIVDNTSFAFMVSPDRVSQLGAFLVELTCNWNYVAVSGNHEWRFLIHRDFSKGALLKELTQIMGLSSSNVLVIGDGLNDVSMMSPEIAEFVGCPANATGEIMDVVRKRNGRIASAAGALGTAEVISYFLHKT